MTGGTLTEAVWTLASVGCTSIWLENGAAHSERWQHLYELQECELVPQLQHGRCIVPKLVAEACDPCSCMHASMKHGGKYAHS